MTLPVYEFNNVSFFAREKSLIKDATFKVRESCIQGFIGSNGAGKSTTLKLMSSEYLPHAGSVLFYGKPLLESGAKLAELVGFLPERHPLYLQETVKDFLTYLTQTRVLKLSPKAAISRVVELLELSSVLSKVIGTLSTGWRQRVALASCMIHSPKILLLDEPFNGLDPQTVFHLRQLFRSWKNEMTLFFSAHQLHEVEQLCDYVTVMKEGKVIFDGELSLFMKERFQHRWVEIETSLQELPKIPEVITAENLTHGKFRLKFSENLEINECLKILLNVQIPLKNVRTHHGELEQFFLGKQ
jgi:ABC-2 type transport system ATP-binding protein